MKPEQSILKLRSGNRTTELERQVGHIVFVDFQAKQVPKGKPNIL
jgi:hypothetical protein